MEKKELDELSTKELGELFPIIISEPNSEWEKIFEIEKKELFKILGHDIALRIEHFGSTAIPNLASKPTIDILVEIPDNETIKDEITKKMKSSGYHYIPRNDCPPPYIMFVKGYTNEGIKGQSYHIHIAEKTHKGLWDRLHFRDYLIKNKKCAIEYENLKRKLSKKYKYSREAYTKSKTDFIMRITEIACVENEYSKLVEYLIENNITISTAESCTGGLIAKLITDVPGSSKVFIGGIVPYSNEMKEKLLGVSPKTLLECGAVSENTVKEMLEGINRATSSDIAIATSGIAGPGGGTELKPVGIVYIGIKYLSQENIKKYVFKGTRNNIRMETAHKIYELLKNL